MLIQKKIEKQQIKMPRVNIVAIKILKLNLITHHLNASHK